VTEILRDWRLDVDVDIVLRGQGADPAAIRARQPRMVQMAERALSEGLALIEPVVVSRELPVVSLRHEQLTLAGGAQLTGALIAQHLAAAERVALIVCTIGEALERRVAHTMRDEPAYALALDGFGSAAAEALGVAACTRVEQQAARGGWRTSLPLSPGMVGWPVDVGQWQIFSLVDAASIGVTLNESAQMLPRKSLSIALGIGRTPFSAGRVCDFCALRETCRYQDHYAPVSGAASGSASPR
jgi:hypothetical protein